MGSMAVELGKAVGAKARSGCQGAGPRGWVGLEGGEVGEVGGFFLENEIGEIGFWLEFGGDC